MNLIYCSVTTPIIYWLLAVEAQGADHIKVGLIAKKVLDSLDRKPVYSVRAESSAECGDICLLLALCERFQFVVVGDPAVADNPQASEQSDETVRHMWNCLIFDINNNNDPPLIDTVTRQLFKETRCIFLGQSLQNGQGILMKHRNKHLFLGEKFDETSAWKKQRGSLFTRSSDGTIRFLGRDICLGWRTIPGVMQQLLILVLEVCVEDMDYVYKYTNITQLHSEPGDNGCKWSMSVSFFQDHVYRVGIPDNQTSELEPRADAFFIAGERPGPRSPLLGTVGEYPWSEVLFKVETRVSLAICRREDIMVSRGKILPQLNNAPMFLYGDTITVTCNEGHLVDLGLASVVLTCTPNTLHAFTCSEGVKGHTMLGMVILAMVLGIFVIVFVWCWCRRTMCRCSLNEHAVQPQNGEGLREIQEAPPEIAPEDVIQDDVVNVREDNL